MGFLKDMKSLAKKASKKKKEFDDNKFVNTVGKIGNAVIDTGIQQGDKFINEFDDKPRKKKKKDDFGW